MRRMTFKKVLLLAGIFLLSTFMLVQFSWGCDDDDDDKDKWDDDRHDKWDCHKHGKPCHPPKIQSVDVDLKNNEIVIFGQNFDNGANAPVVTLGGSIKLKVKDYDEKEIVAELPALTDVPNSDYRLVVSTCYYSACKDKRCKDHGPKCKCKYCKDHCSKCKDKYCKDHEYKCRCRDRYSLTIPGPSGAPSGITLTRVSKPVTLPPGCSECLVEFNDTAVCQGGSVTGGGFSCPGCIPAYLHIVENTPLDDKLSGWRVVGSYFGGNGAELTIYAICAQ